MVALFVVAGTFSLAIVQRRNEIAVLRALGAAPHQVRRLIAGEALIVSVVAGALGLLAGRPLAHGDRRRLADHGTVPPGFAPGHSWIPLVAAFGGGILIAQAAVFAAARRAGRTRPAEALREAAIEHARPGVLQLAPACCCSAAASRWRSCSRARGRSRSRSSRGCCWRAGVGLLGRVLLGLPAALLAWPLRRLGASGLLASPAWPPTAGGPPRWRRRSCSSRCSRGRRASSRPAGSARPSASPPRA